MKNSFIIILFLLSFLFAYSQNETNNWHFGEKGEINFNLENITVLTDSKVEVSACNASIPDHKREACNWPLVAKFILLKQIKSRK